MKVLIGTISFEKRCSAIIRSYEGEFDLSFVYCSKEVSEYKEEHLPHFKEKSHEIRELETSYDGSVDNLQIIQDMVVAIDQLQVDQPVEIFWDVTVTRRELISMTLLALRDLSIPYKLKVLYSDAAEYSIGVPEGKKWLSKGVRRVGTVLGFNGLFYARKNFHLIVFLGLESDRIRALIEKTEPQFVTFFAPKGTFLGIDDDRDRVFKEVQPKCSFALKYIGNDDPEQVCEEVLVTTADRQWNYGLCSFNSKLSAIGFSLAALKNRELRLFYVWAEAYNRKSYSRESDKVISKLISLPI
jgi:hypothetical protein